MSILTGNSGDYSGIALKAAARGDIDLVRRILKKRPGWINRVGPHGRTMLWEAAHKGRQKVAEFLIKKGADASACGTYYTPYLLEISCLCVARLKNRSQLVALLGRNGARIDIHSAAYLGDAAAVHRMLKKNPRLLDRGHDQTAMAEKGRAIDYVRRAAPWATPLCYALKGGDAETVQLLIESGATISGLEQTHFQSAGDNVEMVRLLLNHGAEPDAAPEVHPDDGELYAVVRQAGGREVSREKLSSELVYLCRGDRGGNPQEVQRLIDNGADVNHQDHKGKTALHRAAKSGFLPAMKILLEYGAKIDLADDGGETAIFDAVRSTIKNLRHRDAAIDLLLSVGVSTKRVNRKGQSVIDIAAAGSGPQSVGLVAKLMRKPRKHR